MLEQSVAHAFDFESVLQSAQGKSLYIYICYTIFIILDWLSSSDRHTIEAVNLLTLITNRYHARMDVSEINTFEG